MQGINKSKHIHLLDALLQLERLLSREFKQDADMQQSAKYRRELETMHLEYERLLLELSKVIDGYNELFSKVKIQFLSPKLKELRKQVPQDKPVFSLLAENIRMVYGT